MKQNIETKVNEIVHSNWRITVQEIAENCNIEVGSCHEILVEKLRLHRITAKFAPQLSQDQKDKLSINNY